MDAQPIYLNLLGMNIKLLPQYHIRGYEKYFDYD